MCSVSDEVNCNNSLHAFSPVDPQLVLIDFEYASYNYRGFDFANHFVEYTIDYDVHHPPYYEMHHERFPSVSRQIDFFEAYLKEFDSHISPENLHTQAQLMLE
ncbi:unnamed protein product, partial [Toxocara canis]